jgi:hypothetical protein
MKDGCPDLRAADLLRVEAGGVVSPQACTALAADPSFKFMVVAVAVFHHVSRGLHGRRMCW